MCAAEGAQASRIGVFGGTFNPPHIGHLVCAEAAADALSLDRVVLVPTGEPPHKEVPGDPGPEVRLSLTEIAAADNPTFTVDPIEVRREGPSYTVDTLSELRSSHPDAELVLIIGGDMALGFPQWRDPETITELASLGVVERGDIGRSAMAGALMRFPRAQITIFTMPRCDVSSTEIRERLASGRSVRYLVPDVVLHEIEARGLYGLS